MVTFQIFKDSPQVPPPLFSWHSLFTSSYDTVSRPAYILLVCPLGDLAKGCPQNWTLHSVLDPKQQSLREEFHQCISVHLLFSFLFLPAISCFGLDWAFGRPIPFRDFKDIINAFSHPPLAFTLWRIFSHEPWYRISFSSRVYYSLSLLSQLTEVLLNLIQSCHIPAVPPSFVSPVPFISVHFNLHANFCCRRGRR